MSKEIKAVCLLSGGLDSILAAKIIQEQTTKCIGLHFTSPFFQDKEGTLGLIKRHTEWLNIPLIVKNIDSEYFNILENPKYDYGKGLNPCTDCHTYFLRRAKDLMNELDADFIITGDVVGQRTNSQLKRQLIAIENDSGLKGLIVRPLSGKFMEETIPEKEGWIDRSKMLNFHGKGKRNQKELALKYGITEYSSLSGGCLLTEKGYSLKLRDLLDYCSPPEEEEVRLLSIGRHFRYKGIKIIVGRNKAENGVLAQNAAAGDVVLEVQNFGSPIVLLKSPNSDESLNFAAKLASLYSDCNEEISTVKCKVATESYMLEVEKIKIEDANKYNLTLMKFDARKRIVRNS